MTLVGFFNDHMGWLEYLRDETRPREKEQMMVAHLTPLDLALIDVDALNVAVEHEATIGASQLVAMAKTEAALFVGQQGLAAELADRMWVGLG
jgi:hypothetical protein